MGHSLTLRDYQQKACRASVDLFLGPVGGIGPFDRQMLVIATGGGKTIVAAAVIWYFVQKLGKRCLFLADSDELVEQAVDKIHRKTGIYPDTEKGSIRASPKSMVVVSSIQSMAKANRLARYAPDHFGLVIVDECHLSMAADWQRTLNHYSHAKILGITATPFRLDGKQLLNFYQHIAYEINLFELIGMGYLVPVTVQTVPVKIDLGPAGLVGRDLDDEDLDELIVPYFDAVLEGMREHARDRKPIVFCPLVKSAEIFAGRARYHGWKCEAISGADPDRRSKVQRFRDGELLMMVNALLLGKGFDEPTVDCVVPLRPTKSRAMFQQMVGRGTRLFCPHGCHEKGQACDCPDRKLDMLLLDFLWQYPDHGLIRPENLLEGTAPDVVEAVAKRIREGGQLDLMKVESIVSHEKQKALIRALDRAARKGAQCIDARDWGVIFEQRDLITYEPLAHWEKRKPTPAQLATIARFGIDPKTVDSFGIAVRILDHAFDRMKSGKVLFKQACALIEVDQFDPQMSQAEAVAKINEIRKGRKFAFAK